MTAAPDREERVLCFQRPPTFGPYLRRIREDRGIAIRDAAEQLGIDYMKLYRMETNGRVRFTSVAFFARMADLYGRSFYEILDEAGIRYEHTEEQKAALDRDRAFAALVLHPDLRPFRMNDMWTDSFSGVQKTQWIEFARKLAAHPDPVGVVEGAVGKVP